MLDWVLDKPRKFCTILDCWVDFVRLLLLEYLSKVLEVSFFRVPY